MTRYVCIHGHFYQPPRENAWLEEVEVQDSARPYHDWNERVTAECYEPNSASRILDTGNRIVDIVNNYASISFDAGPTLLAWMEKSSPGVYRAILEADRLSREKFHGHGGAMAQAYNHIIMPLAGTRDKRTQVIWGIRDFESRFGRKPEGMWLPETAVDLESLDIMAEHGILFTVLAPTQASRVRDLKGGAWTDVSRGRIDPKRPYLCRLPSGRTISLFFYDGPISHDVAFGHLLTNGDRFAKRLIEPFSPEPRGPELVHVATDGETYGHHHRFGDMALAYCLESIEANKLARITTYGDFLDQFPPDREVEIIENTAWSCGHGVERWRSDCGDSSGAHPGWNQKWRAPLRHAMDWLGSKAAAVFEKDMASLTRDPWGARDEYIRVVFDRSPATVESFLAGVSGRSLSPDEKIRCLKLLELERHALLMVSSDGWFFDDISNVETVQVVQYASRALQLLRDVTGEDLEPEFVNRLAAAKSNIPELGDGARIYDVFVRPAFVDFLRLGAHYAVSSLFEEYPEATKIAHYSANADVRERDVAGRRTLAVGRVNLKSAVTLEERTISYAVLHLGDLDLTAGVRDFEGESRFDRTRLAIRAAFARSDITAVIRSIDHDFGTRTYSLGDLFQDEKRKVLGEILDDTLRGLEDDYRQIFQANSAIMQAMGEMRIPLPEALAAPAAVVLSADFRRLIEREKMDLEALGKVVDGFKRWSFEPDRDALGFAVSRRIGGLMTDLAANPRDLAALRSILGVFKTLKPLGLDLDLWRSQNIYFELSRKIYPDAKAKVPRGAATAQDWLSSFEALGEFLRVDPVAAGQR
jgi:alpha-amylase/alpha-mannosidase (GH57 family)